MRRCSVEMTGRLSPGEREFGEFLSFGDNLNGHFNRAVRRSSTVLAACALCAFAVGCSQQPKVTKGTFNDSFELTMQRGSMDVVVKTSGPASYTLKQYSMTHPMGPRPNTEATFVTPAGTFNVSSHGDNDLGVIVNGTLYPEPPDRDGRSKVVIDEQGKVTVQEAPPRKSTEPAPEPRPSTKP